MITPSHGGTNPSELERFGLREAEILDLSVNIVPFPLSEPIRSIIDAYDPRTYPDPECREAREALAERYRVPVDHVVLGNGAAELLWTLFEALRPREVLTLDPTFSEFRAAALSKGIPCRSYFDPSGSWPDAESRWAGVDMVYLTHPNNPLGTGMSLKTLQRWADGHPDIWFVADESFLSLSEHHLDAKTRLPDNVLRLRSLTKDHGIAGIRLGYALMAPSVVEAVERSRPPWVVNSLAQAIVPAALESEEGLNEVRERLFRARDILSADLRKAGFQVRASSTIFFMLQVRHAGRVRERLLKHHRIRVRDCTNFGMPEWIRVAVREGDVGDRLRLALSEEGFA